MSRFFAPLSPSSHCRPFSLLLPFLVVVGPDPGTPSVRLVLLLRCTCLGREGDAPDGGLYFIVEGRVDVLVGGWDSKGGDGAPTSPGSGARSRPHHANTRYFVQAPPWL